jgi:hypothetical protein
MDSPLLTGTCWVVSQEIRYGVEPGLGRVTVGIAEAGYDVHVTR